MDERDPVVELDAPFSEKDASPRPWNEARAELEQAGVYWVSTVRPDGRPHVTPVAAIWLDGSLYFSTGPDERKAKNLAGNSHCVVTTGCNEFRAGLDVVIEGDGVKIGDEELLQRLADAFAAKYDDHFGFRVVDGSFIHGEGGAAEVYEVAPVRAFAYGRTGRFTATRFTFRR